MKTIMDALLETCKNYRPSDMLQPPYRPRMGRRSKHVLLWQFCSRKEPLGIVTKTNIHTLRVARKQEGLACAHAMRTKRNYGNESNAALNRNPVAHAAFTTAAVQHLMKTQIDSVHVARKNKRYTYETCRSR